MRDRLSHMQEMSSGHVEPMEYEESATSDSFSNVDLEEELPHEAVVFDNSPALEQVFSQSQDIHREIQLIRLEVKRLREQNSRMLQGVTTMSTIKRDSNAIGADIKARAEGVLSRLQEMDGTAHKLEEVHGSNSAVTRIARTQYACLSNGFRDAMFDYNEAEMSHRENCKAQIQRHMGIVGREVTGEEVEDMIEQGQWNIFSDNIIAEGKTARSALSQIEKRHQELLDLETRIQGIHEIFLDIALLVEEQGPMLDSIQTNVQKTDEGIQDAIVKLGRAKRHDRNNPFKKMFCSCFPCFQSYRRKLNPDGNCSCQSPRCSLESLGHIEEVYLLSDRVRGDQKRMRDMLERLQTITEEQEDDDASETYGHEYGKNKMDVCQEAVVFEKSSDIDIILREAHAIRKEISMFCLQVEHLSSQNERYGTSVRRLTLLKKDSDWIARGIQQKGEALYTRIKALGEESKRLEEKEGPSSAVSRIARVQYDTLTCAFHAAISDYNQAEEMQRQMCRGRIKRQASIMGTEISDEQLDVLVHKGGEGWNELSQSLHTRGACSSRWALCEIRGRHKELVDLEARLREVHDLFLQMAMLVEEQGSMLNNIEASVCKTEEYCENINIHIKKAVQYKRKHPFLQCCPCLPCWRYNQIA
ncbi:uncharacterized protein ACBR49_015651 [Aulostomus maculatus]